MRSARVLGVLLALSAALPADAREFRSSDIYPFDYPTVQAMVLLLALTVLLANLAADMSYGVLDPRVRFGARSRG